MIDVKAILARADAATKGPWAIEQKRHDPTEYEIVVGDDRVGIGEAWGDDGDPNCWPARANATFIAAAREDVPALVAEVERLRALITRVVTYAREDKAQTPGTTVETARRCIQERSNECQSIALSRYSKQSRRSPRSGRRRSALAMRSASYSPPQNSSATPRWPTSATRGRC